MKKIRRIFSIFLATLLVLALTIPAASAASEQTIYLKGSGKSFSLGGWQNVFYLGDAKTAQNPSVVHLEIAPPKEATSITYAQVAFTNGEVWKWSPADGFSTNGGGNNPGFVLVFPADWKIAYVDKGNKNDSDSFIRFTGKINNFNISGFNQGKPDTPPPPPPGGTITLSKTVNGVALEMWLSNFNGKPADVLAGMIFKLCPASGDGGTIDRSAGVVGTLGADGIIKFQGVNYTPRWYAVIEEFVPGSIAAQIFDNNVQPFYIYFDGESVTGRVVGFDYDALYRVAYDTSNIRRMNYPGLNGGGEFFPMNLVNTSTGQSYPSFCANGGSERFAGDNHLGCSGYLVCSKNEPYNKASFVDFLSAFNYIEDHFGNLAENRVITQIVTWALLGAINVNSYEFTMVDISSYERAAVMATMQNFKGYAGQGNIVDLVYFECENHAHDYQYCQPQIVPLYGTLEFVNRPR